MPSGASTGTREAVELRDGDKKRYLGKGVLKAVKNVNTVLKGALLGKDPLDQEALDEIMIKLDGTDNKGNLGANALLAISLANAQAPRRSDSKQSLWKYIAKGREPVMPVPMMNVINGGAHADNSLDVQEFMIIPVGAPTFSEALRYGAEIFHTLKGILKAKKLTTAVGDEGGFAPNLSSNEAGIKVIIQAVEKAGYKLGKQIYLGMDVASSEFYKKNKYDLHGEGRKFTSRRLREVLRQARGQVSRSSASKTAWPSRTGMAGRRSPTLLGKKIQLVGDDLFVTNTKILQGRHRQGHRELHPHQGQPDRHAHRDAGGHRDGRERGVLVDRVAPLGRDRGLDHRGHRRGHQRLADQDGLDVAFGSHRQVQPAAAHRRRARRQGALRRQGRLPGQDLRPIRERPCHAYTTRKRRAAGNSERSRRAVSGRRARGRGLQGRRLLHRSRYRRHPRGRRRVRASWCRCCAPPSARAKASTFAGRSSQATGRIAMRRSTRRSVVRGVSGSASRPLLIDSLLVSALIGPLLDWPLSVRVLRLYVACVAAAVSRSLLMPPALVLDAAMQQLDVRDG